MVGKLPLVAALAALLAANVALAWLFGRRLGGERAGPAPVDRSAGTVVCPACGATNDVDYRFCRDCVGELPTAPGSVDATVRPARQDPN
ncbi:MAG: hypothetical protein ABEJ34_08540 [Haloferacaceae archaeon]